MLRVGVYGRQETATRTAVAVATARAALAELGGRMEAEDGAPDAIVCWPLGARSPPPGTARGACKSCNAAVYYGEGFARDAAARYGHEIPKLCVECAVSAQGPQVIDLEPTIDYIARRLGHRN